MRGAADSLHSKQSICFVSLLFSQTDEFEGVVAGVVHLCKATKAIVHNPKDQRRNSNFRVIDGAVQFAAEV